MKKISDFAFFINTAPQYLYRKKSKKEFSVEWAYKVGREYNLLTEWIMTGEEPKRLSDLETQYKNNMLHDVERWLSGLIEKEPFRKEWFVGTFLDTFPTFARWKKRPEGEESKDTTVHNKAA